MFRFMQCWDFLVVEWMFGIFHVAPLQVMLFSYVRLLGGVPPLKFEFPGEDPVKGWKTQPWRGFLQTCFANAHSLKMSYFTCWVWIVHEHLEWFIMTICQVMMSKCSIQDISPNWGQRFRVPWQHDAISRSTEGSHVISCDAKDSLGSQW